VEVSEAEKNEWSCSDEYNESVQDVNVIFGKNHFHEVILLDGGFRQHTISVITKNGDKFLCQRSTNQSNKRWTRKKLKNILPKIG
jgi:hypothetical protein